MIKKLTFCNLHRLKLKNLLKKKIKPEKIGFGYKPEPDTRLFFGCIFILKTRPFN